MNHKNELKDKNHIIITQISTFLQDKSPRESMARWNMSKQNKQEVLIRNPRQQYYN